MADSLKLMGMIAAVDVVCGPLLSFVVANPNKPRSELIRDFGLIGIVQFLALAYGLYALAQSRPVVLAFDKDRFYVATAVEIDENRFQNALPQFKSLPLFDIRRVGLREAKDSKEFFESIDLSFAGVPPAVRPDWWIPPEEVEHDFSKAKVPLALLMEKHPERAAVIRRHLEDKNLTETNLYYLPLVSEKTLDWIVVFNEKGDILAYIPVDGFQ